MFPGKWPALSFKKTYHRMKNIGNKKGQKKRDECGSQVVTQHKKENGEESHENYTNPEIIQHFLLFFFHRILPLLKLHFWFGCGYAAPGIISDSYPSYHALSLPAPV